MTEGETFKLSATGFSQVKGRGRERLRCRGEGIDVQSDLMLKHVRVENDSGVNLETLPDHPPEGYAGEAVTCAVYHRSTPDI